MAKETDDGLEVYLEVEAFAKRLCREGHTREASGALLLAAMIIMKQKITDKGIALAVENAQKTAVRFIRAGDTIA